jgi:hypothetical protein
MRSIKLHEPFCFIYVQPNREDAPWIIRYTDPTMPEGINEVHVAKILGTPEVMFDSHEDPFLERKIGRYSIKAFARSILIDSKNEAYLYFT